MNLSSFLSGLIFVKLLLFIILQFGLMPAHLISGWFHSSPYLFMTNFIMIVSEKLSFSLFFTIVSICFVLIAGLLSVLVSSRLRRILHYRIPALISINVLLSFLLQFNLNWSLCYELDYTEQQNIQTDKKYIEIILSNLENEMLICTEDSSFKKRTPDTKDIRQINLLLSAVFEKHNLPKLIMPSQFKELYPSCLLGRLGTAGVTSPFTREIHINTELPDAFKPAVTAHEAAHAGLIGPEYAAELAAHIVLRSIDEPFLRYSGLLNAWMEISALLNADKRSSRYARLSSPMYEDISEYRRYWKSRTGVADTVSKFFYDKFLKINKQKDGILTYNKSSELILDFEISRRFPALVQTSP